MLVENQMEHNLKIVLILTVGFGLASLLGYLAKVLKFPSILGYLLAGYLIGPYSPGFVADKEIAEQLAEVGVILMLFGVGLHFKLEDLIKVKYIAIPGAILQMFIAATVTTGVIYAIGWQLHVGVIFGLAIGVASTVVLVRVLTENKLLDTIQGHISVGWLIVEDILTVGVLVLLPMLAAFFGGENLSIPSVLGSIIFMLVKFLVLIVIMFTWGQKAVAFILTSIARLHSHELFTVTVFALIFLIATGSSLLFGTSIALGAFIAGMVIGKTHVRHQAAANSLPLKDIFAILFFLSVGMLFNPIAIHAHFGLFIGILSIILLIKPLAAFLIVAGFGFSLKIALTVAIALAQIGEFSFILAEEAMNLKLLPDEGYDIIVACALISISLNPLLFRLIDRLDEKLQKTASLKFIRAKLIKDSAISFQKLFSSQKAELPKIVIIGFGPIGEEVSDTVTRLGFAPIIIEQNIDTVSTRESKALQIIFGDATSPHILEAAKIESARLLVITVPSLSATKEIIRTARQINPKIRILTRIHYISEEKLMQELNVQYVCDEKECLKVFVAVVKSLAQRIPITIKSSKIIER
jgi:monovalent cation:H+ antiporter-2, CPA2 family